MRTLLQVVALAAIGMLAGASAPSATIIETDDRQECEAQSGGEPFFVLNGKCYVKGDGGEVVIRDDIPSFGLCFGRCEAERACAAPFYDNDNKVCVHYQEQ